MIWLILVALAQQPTEARVDPIASRPKPVRVFGVFQTRATLTDLVSTNPFLDGQVVGTLGGINGITVDPAARSAYTEARAGLFATWRPDVLSGRAGLSGAFEVDFGYGDASYGTGGNQGGGFGGDHVNLQTRRLYAEFLPRVGRTDLHVVAGLQFVADSAADPTATTPDGLVRSGGRLMLFGSEAAGLSIYGSTDDAVGERLRFRLGTYTLAENGFALPDDVWLSMGDVTFRPSWVAEVGLHAWYLQDRSGGTGGLLGYGPTSVLSELQGGPRRNLYDEGFPPPANATVDADLVWLGADVGFNPDLSRGPLGVTAAAFADFGRMYAPIAHDDDIGGLLFDAEARLRYARGRGSVGRVEVLVSSADNADIQRHTGMITGNSYGVVGAVHATHGMLLLFPDPRAINRQVATVYDVSGGQRGLIAGTASFGYDAIPDRLTVGVAGGHALSTTGTYGTEINGTISGTPLPFLTVYGTAGALFPGDAALVTRTAWIGHVGIDWLVF